MNHFCGTSYIISFSSQFMNEKQALEVREFALSSMSGKRHHILRALWNSQIFSSFSPIASQPPDTCAGTHMHTLNWLQFIERFKSARIPSTGTECEQHYGKNKHKIHKRVNYGRRERKSRGIQWGENALKDSSVLVKFDLFGWPAFTWILSVAINLS